MGAKDLVLRPISRDEANALVRRVHYSGKIVNNSQVHIGVYYGGALHGAMQFGPPLDKRKLLPLVEGTPWSGMLELNRMAFTPALPRNSESRALAVAMRLLRKYAPQVQWVVSFADGTQSGDGAIYRAAGFVLTQIKPNDQIWAAPDEAGTREARTSLTDGTGKREGERARTLTRGDASKGRAILHTVAARRGYGVAGGLNLAASGVHRASLRPGIGSIATAASPGGGSSMRAYVAAGFRPLPGYQLRYLYFLDPTARERLTVPVLPFSKIRELGAGMYLGRPRLESEAPANPGGHEGAAMRPGGSDYPLSLGDSGG